MDTTPYWLMPILRRFRRLTETSMSNVAIVGSGLTRDYRRLAHATAGQKVALFDRERCARRITDTPRPTLRLT